MRIIYLGTPEFAVPTLEKLISWPEAEIVALVTQPDRPAGRGKHLFAPPTKMVADAHGIPVLQPEKLSRSPDVVQAMRDLKPDALVMVAFGQILKQEVLTMAPLGVINLHGSLLPKYRGAAPINWAIINGEKVSGNTTMISDQGVDTGPMLLSQQVAISPEMTSEELGFALSVVGAELVIQTLSQLASGVIKPIEQDSSKATMAPRLTKVMGNIDWRKPAGQIHNLVRGLVPWPGAYSQSQGAIVKILSTRTGVDAGPESGLEPGQLVTTGDAVLVACGEAGREFIELLYVQPANRAKVTAADWVNGARLKTGSRLGS